MFVDPGRVYVPAALREQIRPPRRTHQVAPLEPLARLARLAPHSPHGPPVPQAPRHRHHQPQKPVALPHHASDPGPPDACPTVVSEKETDYLVDGAQWTPRPIQGYGFDREDRDHDQAENSFRSWRRFNVRKQINGGFELRHTTIQGL